MGIKRGKMKKILLVVLLMFIIGCSKQHVYHTYYGEIDIDTMEVAYTRDGVTGIWCEVWKRIRSTGTENGSISMVP